MLRIWLLSIGVLFAVVVGCTGVGRAPPADTVDLPSAGDPPKPGSWPQFHGNTQNHGSLFVPSEYALEPKWMVDVGPVVYSSPVVGGTGSVYLGNLNGELIAVHPSGFVQWRVNLFGLINSSAAVSDAGFIYVVSTEVLDDNAFRSTLHVLTPQGALIRSTPLPDDGFTTSSPKIWRSGDQEFIFLYVRRGFDTSSLLVFSRAGILVHRQDMGCAFPVTGTVDWGPLGDFLDVVWDVIWEDGPGLDFDPSGGPEPPLYARYGWLDPSVAIVDNPALSDPEQPLVILVDAACFLKAYRWDAPRLTEVWSLRHTPKDAHTSLLPSSPAIIKDTNRMVVGSVDGTVRGYDFLTGSELWEVAFPQAVMGSPASLGGLVYVTSEEHIRALDTTDGSIVFSQNLSDKSVSSPLLSGSTVYVSQRNELVSLSFDFNTHAHAGAGSGGGLASPAMGPDGTLYSVSLTSDTAFLKAYGGADRPLLHPGFDTVTQ